MPGFIEKTLAELRDLLASGGRLLVQVPDIERTPFDLAVIDHCSHFSRRTLGILCNRAGLKIEIDGTPWIHNCLTLLLGRSETSAAGAPTPEAHTFAAARAPFDWYGRTLRKFEAGTPSGPFAIFGAGMAGIALLTQLPRKPTCILDEDPQRDGSILDGVPILPPSRAQNDLTVILPFAPENAERIITKLRASVPAAAGWTFIVPDEFECDRDPRRHDPQRPAES